MLALYDLLYVCDKKNYFLRLKKKVAFVFFEVESLSNLGNSMSITKLSGKIGFEIFPDFEVP